jgi:hypothetical protein
VNKRIVELAEQAGLTDYMVFGRIESKEDVLKNFAESIIKECADIASINQHQYDSVGKYVLEHFGVKQ